MKLHKAIERVLSEHGDVRKEQFTASNPKREGISWTVSYPYIVVELDDYGILEVRVPNSPNPLFSGDSFETTDEAADDVADWLEYTLDEALDDGNAEGNE